MKKIRLIGVSLAALVMLTSTTMKVQAAETEQIHKIDVINNQSEKIGNVRSCAGFVVVISGNFPIYDDYGQETGRTYDNGEEKPEIAFTKAGRKGERVFVYTPELDGWVAYGIMNIYLDVTEFGFIDVPDAGYESYYGTYQVTGRTIVLKDSGGTIFSDAAPGQVIKVVGAAMDAFSTEPGDFKLADNNYISMFNLEDATKKINDFNLNDNLEKFEIEAIIKQDASTLNPDGTLGDQRILATSHIDIVGKATVNGFEFYKLKNNRFIVASLVELDFDANKEALPQNTIGITKSESGQPANVHKLPGGELTGRTLQRATAWKTYFKYTIAGTTYYQVAPNQWLSEEEFEIINGSWDIATCAATEEAWVDKAEGIPVYSTPGGETTDRILAKGTGWKTFFLAKNFTTGEVYYQVAPDQWLKSTDIRLVVR